MIEPDFDGESVLRFVMTNFDVEDEDNRIGKRTIFSTKGNNSKLNIPVADATALSHLQDACKSVLTRKNAKAAMFVANFMKLSGYIVQRLLCKEQVQEVVLEAVMDVAIRTDCFNMYTRETVLQAAMESAMFTNSQREMLMERLAKTWGESIWSTEHGLWNCPTDYFRQFPKGDGGKNGAAMKNEDGPRDPTKQPTARAAPGTDRIKCNVLTDEGLNAESYGSSLPDEDSQEYYSYKDEEGTHDRGIWNSVRKENVSVRPEFDVTGEDPSTELFTQFESPSLSLF